MVAMAVCASFDPHQQALRDLDAAVASCPEAHQLLPPAGLPEEHLEGVAAAVSSIGSALSYFVQRGPEGGGGDAQQMSRILLVARELHSQNFQGPDPAALCDEFFALPEKGKELVRSIMHAKRGYCMRPTCFTYGLSGERKMRSEVEVVEWSNLKMFRRGDDVASQTV